MGKVITVMNMKGGVGKTTVALHVGGIVGNYRLAGIENFKRVLLIDYDPQFNLSQAYLPAKTYFSLEAARKTTLAILSDADGDLNPYEIQVPGNHIPPKVSDIRSRILQFADGGYFDIVPSTLDLMYLALGQTTHQLKPIEERFEKFIDQCKSEYDLVIIDCHPAGSIFTKTSLRNSDAVLIPVVPQRYAVRGIGLMLKFIQSKSPGNRSPQPYILFNRTARRGVSDVENSIRANADYGPYCLMQTLKYYKVFEEPEGGRGFVWQSTKPYSNEAFRNITAVVSELIGKLK